MINIVIPMAGHGSRFVKAGYMMPKPLIDVKGHPMIEWVTNNIRPKAKHRFIYICQKEHLKKFEMDKILMNISPDCKIITVDKVTDGAACTVLLAAKYIDNENQLMIANSDQFVEVDIDKYLGKISGYDGLIMTMKADDPKWSFIKYNSANEVTMLREKEVISDEATVGIYNFKYGSDFVKYAKRMIDKNIKVNNEFYVAPVYNEMIEDKKVITFYNIGSDRDRMHGLGIPDDLNKFLKTDINIFE